MVADFDLIFYKSIKIVPHLHGQWYSSTINQLIFLGHKIYEALEGGKEVRVLFLDII